MSDDPTYRKARAALREAQAQAQIAMSELRLRGEFYHDLNEVLRLLDVVHAELVVSLPAVRTHLEFLDAVRTHLELLDTANDASHAGMRPYVSIEDEELKPGGMVASPGKSVIIGDGEEEYLVPGATLEWWQCRNREDFQVDRFRSGLNDPEKCRITHTPTGRVTSAGDFWTAVHRMRTLLEMEES